MRTGHPTLRGDGSGSHRPLTQPPNSTSLPGTAVTGLDYPIGGLPGELTEAGRAVFGIGHVHGRDVRRDARAVAGGGSLRVTRVAWVDGMTSASPRPSEVITA
ncbi:hypothetical protein GCM10010307_66810 [Streptomyces vastus]|uniref:Uncharacterized protein n=1 Tax=Streptomyces vastus TaxID=285451 RepID=A0ABN3RK00_9ACTN